MRRTRLGWIGGSVMAAAMATGALGGCGASSQSGPASSTAPSTAASTPNTPNTAPVVTSSTETAPTTPSATPNVKIAVCNRYAIRPAEIILGCADANTQLQHLTYQVYGPTQATAVGTLHENDCQPNCATGTYHSYPARAVFDRPQPDGGGVVLSRVTVTFPGAHPPGKSQLTYPLG